MNKLFRKTRGQSRTLASTDDPPESSDDATKLLATDVDQQQSGVAGSSETTSKTDHGDTFDVVLRLEVPSVPKLRSSSIDASCLHQGEMNDIEGSATSGGAGGRGNSSLTGSDASLVDREQGATTSTLTSSLLRVDLPKCFRRRSFDVPRLCIHCVHLEAMAATMGGHDDSSGLSSPLSPVAGDVAGQDSRCSTPSDADLDSMSDDEDLPGYSTTDYIPSLSVAAAFDMSRMESEPSHTLVWHHQQQQQMSQADDQHKFYLTSPDSQKFPVVTTAASADTFGETDERASSGGGSNRSSVGSGDGCTTAGPSGDWKETVTLQVPLIKPRSSSLDVTYYASSLRPPVDANADDDRRCSCENLMLPDAAKHRSTSVDVNLPTDASGGSYRAITCYAADSNK